MSVLLVAFGRGPFSESFAKVQPMETPEIRLVPIRQLRRNERNARTHSKKQIRQIANSILQFGWTYPLLADESGLVVAGNGRLEAAKTLGLHEVPVIVLTGLSDGQKRALAL